ncbi:MAG TPA: transcriptional repressor [Candidatus Peribacterales bacterium]|nr:transcriptional repressor [Candidatus Peribacterales bacterium]
MQEFEEVDKWLHQAMIRTTLPRRTIARMLKKSHKPLRPLEIRNNTAKHGSPIDLVTIYRTLTLFEKKHIAHRHPSSGGYLFCSMPEEEGHHGFLTCLSCKRTEEFHEPEFCKLEDSIARRAKFSATRHISEIIGMCSQCRS